MPSPGDVLRRARVERHRRAGVPPAAPVDRFEPSASFPSPVTAAEGKRPVALVAAVEDDGVLTGVIFKTGGPTYFVELSAAAGELRLRVTSNSVLEIDETFPRDTGDVQPHTYAVAVVPAYPLVGGERLAAHVWVDGQSHLFALGTSVADPASGWAIDTEAWQYGQLANEGRVEPLELLRDVIPGVF